MPEEQNWRDSLSEELRDHKTLQDVKDVEGLAKQFIDSQQMIGQSIRVPGPDAGEDALKAFHAKLTEKVPGLIPTPDPDNPEVMSVLYNRMGRPEAPEGYEHPEGVDATQMADFAKLAHEQGLTNKQYKAILEAVNGFAQQSKEQAAADLVDGIRELKQEWGIVYEDNLELIDSVLKGTGAPKEMLELAANKQLPAAAMKWIYNIGKQLGQEGVNFDKDETTTRLPPAEALARAEEIMADRTGPYWDSSHPQHREYIQRVVDLRRAAAAGGL